MLGPVGCCCCSPWGTAQLSSPSPRASWLQAGLGAAGLLKPWEILAWPPWEPASLSMGSGAQTPNLPPCMGWGSEDSTNSEKNTPQCVRRLMRGQTLPVKRTLTVGSCCCAAIPRRTWGHPFLPAPGAHLIPLPAFCQAAPAPTGALGGCQPCSPPASPAHPLPGSAGKLASLHGKQGWCPAGSALLLSMLRCFLREPMLPCMHIPPVLRGKRRGMRGVMGQRGGDACTAGRGCRQLGTTLRAQQRQGRRSRAKSPEEGFAQRLPPKG